VRLRPPAEVRARAQGGRVLGWLPSGGSTVIATDTALVLPEGEQPASIPWELVVRVSWGADSVEITAQERAGSRPVVHRLPVTGSPAAMAEAVRERVNASIVVQHHVELVGERGARLVARRAPGSEELRWSVVFDAGLDPSDPALRDQADAALSDLRASLGV
jgi:hypothetical protein